MKCQSYCHTTVKSVFGDHTGQRKSKNYHTVGTIPKSNIKIVEDAKSIPLQTIT